MEESFEVLLNGVGPNGIMILMFIPIGILLILIFRPLLQWYFGVGLLRDEIKNLKAEQELLRLLLEKSLQSKKVQEGALKKQIPKEDPFSASQKKMLNELEQAKKETLLKPKSSIKESGLDVKNDSFNSGFEKVLKSLGEVKPTLKPEVPPIKEKPVPQALSAAYSPYKDKNTKNNSKDALPHTEMLLKKQSIEQELIEESLEDRVHALQSLIKAEHGIKPDLKPYIGQKVKVFIDKKKGLTYEGITYPLNMGYIPDTVSGDGEEIDVYILGEKDALSSYEGLIIALIERQNDQEDRLVIANYLFSKEEIALQTSFMEEQYNIIIHTKE